MNYDIIITFLLSFVLNSFIRCTSNQLRDCCSQLLEIPFLTIEVTNKIDHIAAAEKIRRILENFLLNIFQELLFIKVVLLSTFSAFNIVINARSYQKVRFLHRLKLFRYYEIIIFKIPFGEKKRCIELLKFELVAVCFNILK